MQDGIIPFEQEREAFFIEEIWPKVEKVRIYDFNEFAYRFYHILKQRKIPIELVGAKWDFFMPGIVNEEKGNIQQIPESNCMCIYAEGTELVPAENTVFGKYGRNILGNWLFIEDMCYVNKINEVEKIRKFLVDRNIVFLSAYFPKFEELGVNYTYEEYWRYRTGFVYGGSDEIKRNHKHAKEQRIKVGEYQSYESMVEVLNKHRNSVKTFENQDLKYIRYGNGAHTIYLIGPCIAESYSVADEESMGAYLLHQVLQYKKDYSVTCIVLRTTSFVLMEEIILSISLIEGDIVLYMDLDFQWHRKKVEYKRDIDLMDIINTRTSDWFWNEPIHTNQVGNREIAKALVDKYLVQKLSDKSAADSKIIQTGKCCLRDEVEKEIQKYIISVKEKIIAGDNIGSIVMNCNPITNGHLYLIKEALKQVNFLYIFVVSEDRSEFPFEDRFEMVKAATQKYKNIKIIPSGKFVLSYKTMPLYFEKAERQEEVLDGSQDLEIFCTKIAPELKITVRFVGEEPNDKITKQYNDTMKKMLPRYHMRLVEIPRLEHERTVISASTLRTYLKENRLKEVEKLMPKEAYRILTRQKIEL